ncbi:MAG: aminopeptidase P family protein [Armatimonadetes bacterium]|nr:aminopeptidase P family protein [Armatimonadota bacterium]
MNDNLNRVRKAMDAQGVSAMLVSDIGNLQWLTGFTGSSGLGVVTDSQTVFLTDSRYTLQAQQEVVGFEVITFGSPKTLNMVLAEELSGRQINRIGFEPSCSYTTYEGWRKEAPGVDFEPKPDLLPPLRMIKTSEEIAKIRAACNLADACFDHVLRMIQPGVSEYDIALDIEFFIRRQGAALAFDVIAVSGPNSAKPHGKPSEKKLESGDFLTLDFGARLDGYNSDITRTVVVGQASDRHKMIYNRVLESQMAAIDALKPGANGKEVDLLVRSILDKDNLSQYFGHGLGHGLGRAVHDYGGLSQTKDQPIEPGQVWTVEPGVYIPGFGGVRIEDDIVVTESGCEILTTSPKHLLELGA